MDFEKLYKDALERAKKLKETCDSTAVVGWCEYIFPEIESEDEKIRKTLIKFHKSTIDIDGIKGGDIIAWLEKQGEKSADEMIEAFRIEYEKGRADAITEMQGKQKPAWSEEDERLCKCLIKDQEKALDDVRNDKYGHAEIISDLKDMYRERIDWLKSLKERMKGE